MPISIEDQKEVIFLETFMEKTTDFRQGEVHYPAFRSNIVLKGLGHLGIPGKITLVHYIDGFLRFGHSIQYVSKVLVKPVLQILEDELCEVSGTWHSVKI